MAELNRYIELVGSLSGNDGDLMKNLQSELSKRQEVLMANPAALDTVLGQFDFQKHSLGALHVLYPYLFCSPPALSFLLPLVFIYLFTYFLVVLSLSKLACEVVLVWIVFGRLCLCSPRLRSVMAVMKAKQDPVTFVNQSIRFLIQCSPAQIRLDPKKCTKHLSFTSLALLSLYPQFDSSARPSQTSPLITRSQFAFSNPSRLRFGRSLVTGTLPSLSST